MPKTGTVRPTGARVREAVFNILCHFAYGGEEKRNLVLDAKVLDLFCGSGAFALEAISRGAAKATLVDVDSASVAVARKNVVKFGEHENVSVMQIDAALLPVAKEKFDLVFLDPPYNKGLIKPCLERLVEGGWLAEGAVVVVECEEKENVPEIIGLQKVLQRHYGVTNISFLQ